MIEKAGQGVGGGGATVTGAHPTGDSLDTCPEDVLYETELEDMCEQDPSTWEDLASQRWHAYSQFSNETVDSTTGEILAPVKVQAGCDEELGFMSQMHVGQSDPWTGPQRSRGTDRRDHVGIRQKG